MQSLHFIIASWLTFFSVLAVARLKRWPYQWRYVVWPLGFGPLTFWIALTIAALVMSGPVIIYSVVAAILSLPVVSDPTTFVQSFLNRAIGSFDWMLYLAAASLILSYFVSRVSLGIAFMALVALCFASVHYFCNVYYEAA
jgi:hypothetical protein